MKEKQLSVIVLESILYAGASLYNLCGFNFFFFWHEGSYWFGCFAVFFPQHVLAVIPLIEDAQVCDLHRLQEGGGSSWCLIPGPSAAAAACVCLWSLRWEQRLTPAPGACVGGALLPESMRRKKLLWQSPPFLVPTPVIAQAASHIVVTTPSPPQAVPTQSTPVLSLV